MFHSNTNRFLDALSGLFFLILAGLLGLLAAQIKIHDGNYVLFYLGAGVWLECIYVSVHFILRAILVARPRLAEKISSLLGVLLMIPLGLIILILVMLLEQSIRLSHGEPDERISDWVIGTLVLLLIVAPAFLILRNVVSSFIQRRAEQALGADTL